MTDTPLFLRLKANEEAFRLRNGLPPMTSGHVHFLRAKARRMEAKAAAEEENFDQALEDNEEYNRELARQTS